MNLTPEKYIDIRANNVQWKYALKLISMINEAGLKPDIIIDMGSGDGAVTKELATRVPHRQLVAIDVNPAMIEYSQRVNSLPTIEYAIQDLSLTWPELGPDVRLLEAKVDLIFSNHCFHYIRDKTRVLSICRRLLATGGTIHASILLLPDLNRKLPADRRKGWCLSVDQQLDVWRRAVADNGLTADVFEVFEEDYRFTRTQIIDSIGVMMSTYKTYFETSDQFDSECRDLTALLFDVWFNAITDRPNPNAWTQFLANEGIGEAVFRAQLLTLIARKTCE